MKILLTLYVNLFSIICFAQSNTQITYAEYTDKYFNNKGSYNYVYFSEKGASGKMFSVFFENNKKTVLAVFLNDTLLHQKIYDTARVFDIVKANRKIFNQIAGNHAQYFNPESNSQLGIRYKGIHYNHFDYAKPDFIASVKKEKIKDGLLALNELIELTRK